MRRVLGFWILQLLAASSFAATRIDLNGEFACRTKDQDFYCFGAGDGGESFNHRN